MSAAATLADIDAAIARSEWWMSLFDALSESAMKQLRALKPDSGEGLARVVQALCRLALAVRLAIVAAMRLNDILHGLADLRRLAPEAIAAARLRARARAEEAAAARAKARDKARAKREGLKARPCEGAVAPSDEETPDRETRDVEAVVVRDRDPVVEALDRRLTVDPACVDFDALPLRRTVERICAALDIIPDWRRWEAGDWTMGEPTQAVHRDGQPQNLARPSEAQSRSPAIPARPGLIPLRTDTAIGLILAAQAGPTTPSWPPLE